LDELGQSAVNRRWWAGEDAPRRVRIGLVGAVKSKRRRPAPATELYTSALFRGRRASVERSCARWFVLSAREGLVNPDTVLEPSEESLTLAPAAIRRAWSALVVDALVRELGDLEAYVFEIHAGAAYREFGLVAGLERRGALVEVPVKGLSQGAQLAFYAARRAGG
jgi:hypothetical protein